MFDLLSLLKSPKGLLLLLGFLLVNVYFGVVDSLTSVPDAQLKLVYQSHPAEETVFFKWVELLESIQLSDKEGQAIHKATQAPLTSHVSPLIKSFQAKNKNALQLLSHLAQATSFSVPYAYHPSNVVARHVELLPWFLLLRLESLHARELMKAKKPEGFHLLLSLYKAAALEENGLGTIDAAMTVNLKNNFLREVMLWQKAGWLSTEQRQKLKQNKELLTLKPKVFINGYKAEYTYLQQTIKPYNAVTPFPYLYQPMLLEAS